MCVCEWNNNSIKLSQIKGRRNRAKQIQRDTKLGNLCNEDYHTCV
jgi:hypothetical protein